MVFVVGLTFKSYKEVEEALKIHEKATFAKYWKRDARLIASSRIKRVITPELRYYELKYTCIFRGQCFRKRINSNVKEIKTFKKEIPCPAFISLRASLNGKFLEVKNLNNTHNHETNKYYKKKQRLFHSLQNNHVDLEDVASNIDQTVSVATGSCSKPKSYAQKRKKALLVTDSIADLMGQSCNSLFDHRMEVLKSLELLWKQGKYVKVDIIEEQDLGKTVNSGKNMFVLIVSQFHFINFLLSIYNFLI
ncbi:hypothetical protein ABEB36_014189 [Hypothenemus hampei]|uniref:ZSWIM3 N-terminal domain-containing protein n=1 Tax=Hypothenemus hampei TaxID=57062 RepID=A0ABD1E4G8_HYPHA